MTVITPDEERIECEVDLKDVSILDLAEDHGFHLEHECCGNARCTTCQVLVEEGEGNLSEIEEAELDMLDAQGLEDPSRLGCQARVTGKGDVVVRIPKNHG